MALKHGLSTYVMGNAVLKAVQEVKRQVLERAAKMLGVPTDNIEIKDRQVYVKIDPSKRIAFAEVVKNAIYNFDHECLGISAKSSFEPKKNAPPFSAVFVEVEVDSESATVRLLRLVLVHDIGRAINPTNVEGQLEGGALQGIGYALTEDYVVNANTGVVESDSFTTYKIPSTLDLPETEMILVEQPTPSGPFGAKSVGESGMNSVAPAIANAIYDAIGIRVKDLRITPEKILEVL